jgi:hypothetical protein
MNETASAIMGIRLTKDLSPQAEKIKERIYHHLIEAFNSTNPYYLQSFLDTDREHIQRFPKETRLSVTHKNQITTLIIRNIRNRKLGKNATHSIIQDIENILCDNPKIVHIPTQNTTTQVTNALRDESNLIRLPSCNLNVSHLPTNSIKQQTNESPTSSWNSVLIQKPIDIDWSSASSTTSSGPNSPTLRNTQRMMDTILETPMQSRTTSPHTSPNRKTTTKITDNILRTPIQSPKTSPRTSLNANTTIKKNKKRTVLPIHEAKFSLDTVLLNSTSIPKINAIPNKANTICHIDHRNDFTSTLTSYLQTQLSHIQTPHLITIKIHGQTPSDIVNTHAFIEPSTPSQFLRDSDNIAKIFQAIGNTTDQAIIELISTETVSKAIPWNYIYQCASTYNFPIILTMPLIQLQNVKQAHTNHLNILKGTNNDLSLLQSIMNNKCFLKTAVDFLEIASTEPSGT